MTKIMKQANQERIKTWEELPVDRRQVTQGVALAGAAALIPHTAWAQDSGFDASSTAEEVTEGLDLTGKTALITGGNSGLGYETMRVLTMRGAHVICAARTQEKAKKACDSIEGKTTPVVCELTDFGSVVACADEVKALDDPLDMVICNAGIMALPELQQVRGIERHFLVNHLGHFILGTHLMEALKAAPQGRLVMVSSLGYKWAPPEGIQFDNLSGEKGEYDSNMSYGQSKLANALFAMEAARRFEGTNATANAIHPGIINTNLGRHMPWYTRLFATLLGWTFMKSIPEGAATQTFAAAHPSLDKVSGKYFEDCNVVTPEGPHMMNAELAAKLWDVSEELTKDYLA